MAESLYYGIKIISQRSLNDWSYQQRVHPKQGSGKNYEFKKFKKHQNFFRYSINIFEIPYKTFFNGQFFNF